MLTNKIQKYFLWSQVRSANWNPTKTGILTIAFPFSFLDIFKNVQKPKPKKTFGKNSCRNTEKVI
jgi:hypothetical protein